MVHGGDGGGIREGEGSDGEPPRAQQRRVSRAEGGERSERRKRGRESEGEGVETCQPIPRLRT